MHRIRRLQESLRLSANSTGTGLASKTRDRICVHRTPEGNLHQQLDDSPPTPRKQHDQTRPEEFDIISPKLVTAALESLFRLLTCETRGVKIEGKYLCHLHFADDILICANI